MIQIADQVQTAPKFTESDISLLSDIADGFSTQLHYDRLDDFRKRFAALVRNDPPNGEDALHLRIATLERRLLARDIVIASVGKAMDDLKSTVTPVTAVQIHDEHGFRGVCIVMNDGSIVREQIDTNGRNWHECTPAPRTLAALQRNVRNALEQMCEIDEREPSQVTV
jgi:hypothetical protein